MLEMVFMKKSLLLQIFKVIVLQIFDDTSSDGDSSLVILRGTNSTTDLVLEVTGVQGLELRDFTMDMQGNIWAGSNSFKFVGCDSLLIRNCVFNSNPYNSFD